MRGSPTALALAALLLLPLGAALPNECTTDTAPADGVQQACLALDLSDKHFGAPVLNGLPYFDVFYLWLGPGPCRSNPVSDACNGQSSGQDGIARPDGAGTIPVPGAFSVLYQETNGAAGLQRARILNTFADRTVLV